MLIKSAFSKKPSVIARICKGICYFAAQIQRRKSFNQRFLNKDSYFKQKRKDILTDS